MEDFDLFTYEIDYTKPVYKNLLNNYVKNIPHTPSGPNYESRYLRFFQLVKCYRYIFKLLYDKCFRW